MKQYVVDAFADRVFEGNPAAVCLPETWPDGQQMLSIARENRLPETAFAVREGADFSAVKAAAEQALASFFSGRRLGGPVLLAELGDLLYHVEGVENYRLLAPAADLAAEDGTLPMLGRVTVTEMEADDDV